MEKRNSQCEHGKQEACFAPATQVWLAVNHNTSIALASELGSCQSNLCHSGGYEWLQKSNYSLEAFFENVNIVQ